MAKKYHINDDGVPGECEAKIKCRFGGDSGFENHFSTPEAAQIAYEEKMKESLFTVIKTDNREEHTGRAIQTFDESLNESVETAQEEFSHIENSEQANAWVNEKLTSVEAHQNTLDATLPGTAERLTSQIAGRKAREALLAADLVVWKDSDFYSESVEERMRNNAVMIADADSSIDKALADDVGKISIAKTTGLSPRDVENILEVVHKDYMRPRAGVTSSIGKLATNDNYINDTAYVFRAEPEAVKAVLNYASDYSKVRNIKNDEEYSLNLSSF